MWRDERGSIIVLTNIVLVAILIITSLVVDVGVAKIKDASVSGIADAAALAGARELAMGSTNTSAINVAIAYCEENDIDESKVSVKVENGVEVTINEEVDSIFAKIIGVNKIKVNANSKAKYGSISEIGKGIRPVVVENQQFTYGQLVTLKSDTDSYSGNYGAVALGGNGACTYKYNIMYGYDRNIKVGDKISTEPGNMKGPTDQAIDYVVRNDDSTVDNYTKNSEKLWVIPVVDSLSVDGRKDVTVVGFAQFFVEDSNNRGEITGRFIKSVASGIINEGQTNYGLMAVKLVKG